MHLWVGEKKGNQQAFEKHVFDCSKEVRERREGGMKVGDKEEIRMKRISREKVEK